MRLYFFNLKVISVFSLLQFTHSYDLEFVHLSKISSFTMKYLKNEERKGGGKG